MVSSFARRFATGLALAAFVAASFSVAARADDTAAPTATHYQTAITTVYGSQYPVAGHLDLEIFSNGIVRGYYHNAFQKAFIQVNGGRDGNYLWFDIGPTLVDLGLGIAPGGRLHVVATMGSDNGFRGQLYTMYANADSQIAGSTAAMLADPQPTPAEQYIFAAKPVDKSDEDYPFTTTKP